MSSYYKFTDNSQQAKEELKGRAIEALTQCGMLAESYAKKLCPVDTGNLRNSIGNRVVSSEPAVYIGTDVEYAPYVELGTGIYAVGGEGTDKDSWVYKGDDGKWHMAYPQKPKRFLRKAVSKHAKQYRRIIDKAIRGY